MNKNNINDKNAALAASRSASWRRGILIVRKFATIFFIFLMSAACQAKSPSTNLQTPTNPPPTQAVDRHTITNGTQSLYNQIIFVGNKKLNVQIVKTEKEMEQGLSGRNKLSDSEGMLFDFGKLNRPAFWMKDMNFDLDLIWIANKKVVGITNDVPAPARNWKLEIGNLPTYSPPTNVDMVLEVNAGWSKENGIKIGDEVIDKN